MSKLADVAEALKNRGMPKKTYQVRFQETEDHEVVVDATSEEQAKMLAIEEMNNGNGSSLGSTGAAIVSCMAV